MDAFLNREELGRVSNGSLDAPYKGSNSHFLVSHIEFFNRLEERRHFVVIDDRDNTRVHLRPCMRTASGFAAVGTTTLHLLKEREALNAQYIQHIFNTAGIGLIENDHNTLHK